LKTKIEAKNAEIGPKMGRFFIGLKQAVNLIIQIFINLIL